MIKFLPFLLLSKAFAAPCCSGASQIPFLITTDDQAMLSTSFIQGSVLADAFHGLVRKRTSKQQESLQTVLLQGAIKTTDRSQVALQLPLTSRQRSLDSKAYSAQGLGDLRFIGAYEILPEWAYSVWKPKGFSFIQLTMPTAPSIYDAKKTMRIDARGKGFWGFSLGTAFLKTVASFDFVFLMELHSALPRMYKTRRLEPGLGYSGLIGAGYSPRFLPRLRLGIAAAPSSDGGVRLDSVTMLPKKVWTLTVAAAYALPSDLSIILSFADQTFFPNGAQNVELSRTLALTIQNRFPL